MLLIDATLGNVLIMLGTSLVGIISVAAALTNFFVVKMTIIERVLFLIGGLFLVTTNMTFNLVGIVVIAIAIFLQIEKRKKLKLAVASN
jgi:TRAP-type uncharacterized transport system fused permease subunit